MASIDLGGLAASDGFVIIGDAAGDFAGTSVSSAGDVNGDGFADLIIGAPYGDDGGDRAGEAYVIFGKAGGFGTVDLGNLAAADGFVIQGANIYDEAGTSVSSAGDINGDGVNDIIVGAYGPDYGGDYSGAAYVIFGKTSGLADIDLGSLAAADGFVIEGAARFDSAGTRVASAGDVNGDGFDDMLVGAPYGQATYGWEYAGVSYLIFGKAGGFADIDLAVLDPTDGFRIEGAIYDAYAAAVSSAGDINGDGFDDIIVGAREGGDYGGFRPGEAYVIFGKASGFADIDVGNLAAADGFTLRGEADNDNAGVTVSSAGDINDDGFDDIVIGAPGNDEAGVDAGAAYVLFGKASGFTDIDLSSLAAGDGFVISGDAEGDKLGAVSSAGDFNGDGFADIIVGAPHGDDGGTSAGEAYVIFGKASGFGPIDLSSLAPEDGLILQGGAFDWAGYSVASAGDLNGDGFDDLVVGAKRDARAGLDSGSAYVIFGRASGGGTPEADNLEGTAGNDRLAGFEGNDVLSGLGGNDRLDGGANNDQLDGGDGDDILLGGSGIDTARYADAGAGIALRLSRATAQDTLGAGVDTLDGIENAIGSAFADNIAGTTGANRLEGGGGDDSLGGQAGKDVLIGAGGNDVLRGGRGNDQMRGGAADDIYFVNDAGDQTIEGLGQGYDQVKAFVDHVLADNIEELRLFGAAATGTGNGLDNAIFGSSIANTLSGLGGNDTLRGQSGVDTLHGGDDADILYGALGNDSLFGDAGADRLNGEDGVDTLDGGAGDDRLFGEAAADILDGGTGKDALNGGTQRDTMTGGADADQFVFDDGDTAATRNGADIITDFNRTEGDRINLRQVDANADVGGDQNFTFVGDAAFSGAAGELRYSHAQGNTYIEGDTNGDGSADFMIRLDGIVEPIAGDFAL
ncbi:hypothetical protein ACFQRC_03675 [Enterovirga sp. GCM10030262]|uniref:hypothetical protein n=1 Tax=Enterovirga sp. GCM10030262 TaxID=3273391 RepID=UPI00360B2F5F